MTNTSNVYGMSETQDTVANTDNQGEYTFSSSPACQISQMSPGISNEFGGLKKNEAVELFFKRLNMMLNSIKPFFLSDINTISMLD